MLFAFIGTDKPGHLATRMAARPDHLEYLKGLGDKLRIVGPFLDGAGDMNGSLVVIEAADLADAKAAFDQDPYLAVGLFAATEIRAWRIAINKLTP
jgi:uncharacterized protein